MGRRSDGEIWQLNENISLKSITSENKLFCRNYGKISMQTKDGKYICQGCPKFEEITLVISIT